MPASSSTRSARNGGPSRASMAVTRSKSSSESSTTSRRIGAASAARMGTFMRADFGAFRVPFPEIRAGDRHGH